MQAQWSAHSLRTRLPEPQVWGGWGPTPKERNSFSSSRISRINARVRSAGVSPTPPQIPHNADHATSVGIRAGHPPAASSRGRAPRPHAAAPLVRSSSHGRGLGTRISGLHTAYPIVIRLTCSAVGRKPQLPYHSNSISLHSRCTSIGLHSRCSSTCATASLPATASGHAFGSRPPFASIRTCTRVRVHPLNTHDPSPDPSPTLLHMEWSRGRGLVAPSS